MTARHARRGRPSARRSAGFVGLALIGAAGWLIAAGSPTGGVDGTDPQRGRGALLDPSRNREPIEIQEDAGDRGFDVMRAEYVAMLRTVAEDEAAAAQAIANLQREAYRASSLSGLQKLHRFQVSFATTLAARDRRCLRPIIWTHYESAALQTGADDRPVRAPALQLTADLAGTMCRSARSDDERLFATDIMICSAYTLLDDGSRIQADELFGRIVHLAPGTTLAWLGAAAIDERYGRYGEVVDLLSAADSDVVGDEGQLRLAVNLARTGAVDRSREVLTDLLAGTPRTWVRIVATEELARRHIEAHDLAGAETVLRAALNDLPSVSGLRVQLAWVLDQAGQSSTAIRELEAISGADDAVAARFRYAAWPQFDRVAKEANLHEAAMADAPVLAAVIAAAQEGRHS